MTTLYSCSQLDSEVGVCCASIAGLRLVVHLISRSTRMARPQPLRLAKLAGLQMLHVLIGAHLLGQQIAIW